MKQKRRTAEETIRILREVDNGKNVEAACREHNITTTSYYRWKKNGVSTNPQLSLRC